MSGELKPKPGFDWSKVVWGGPDAIRTERCSYCREPLTDSEVPLILSTKRGYVAEFCTRCQETWWGFESFGDEEIS